MVIGKRVHDRGVQSRRRKGKGIARFAMRLWHQRSGISSVEYALLLALIGSGIVVAANALSESVADQMDRAAECLDGTNPDCTT